MKAIVDGVGYELVEVFGNGSDVFGDGPLVVVENNDEAFGGARNIVEGFHCDAACEGGIAANCDYMVLGLKLVACCGHAEGGGKCGACVACSEGVVLALAAGKKTAESAGCADAVELRSVAAGQKFVDVALMGNIEGELVLRCVEDEMERYGEFNDA